MAKTAIARKLPAALEEIQALQASTGLVAPRDVVNAARDPSSALHPHFTWDDDEAADRWRLMQATALIRTFKIEWAGGDGKPIEVRALVSLGSDRIGGGGYRQIGDVMSSKDLKGELLRTARTELRSFVRRYRSLEELIGVVGAAREILGDEEVEE